MNKAFVKEQDQESDDDLPDSTAVPSGTRNYMTPAGYAALRDELSHLMNQERPAIVQIVSWAASNGDRSENGDYLYGKKRLREIDRRMRFLTKRLDIAEVVNVTPPIRSCNTVPSRMTYEDSSGKLNTLEYQVMGICRNNGG